MISRKLLVWSTTIIVASGSGIAYAATTTHDHGRKARAHAS